MGRILAVASVLALLPAAALAAQAPPTVAQAPAESPAKDVTHESAPLIAPVQVFVAQLARPAAPLGWSGHRKAGTQPEKPVAPSPADDGFGQNR